jgi:hypothetical protein
MFAARRLLKMAALIAGVLYAGAAFASAIGLALLPMCMFVVGLPPVLTAYVFARRGFQASRASQSRQRLSLHSILISAGFLGAMAFPILLYVVVGDWLALAIGAFPFPVTPPQPVINEL